MKKIIIMVALLAMSTVSARAISLPAMPDLGNFELTLGMAQNQGVFGATATETNEDAEGVTDTGHIKKESGVFTDGYSSQFIEIGVGKYVSVGYEHTPDSVSTPVNTTRADGPNEGNVSVDFNDLNTTYIKVNVPFLAGLYLKGGEVETDLDIKETMLSGSTYKNVSTNGSTYGVGYARTLGETAFAIRFETMYLELDTVNADNGVASGTRTGTANANNRNAIEAKNLQGLTAKVALTYTFGKN